MQTELDIELEKVRWACRRGMLECDLFLVPFFEQYYQSLTAAERDCFKTLLQESDAVLISWLLNQECPQDPAMAAMIQRIKQNRI